MYCHFGRFDRHHLEVRTASALLLCFQSRQYDLTWQNLRLRQCDSQAKHRASTPSWEIAAIWNQHTVLAIEIRNANKTSFCRIGRQSSIMSHNHGGMSMGSVVLPALPEFPKFYYAVVGSAVAVATLVNVYNILLCRQRLSATSKNSSSPAKPKSLGPLWTATLFALTREASNFSVRIPLKGRLVRLPTVGRTSLVLINVAVLLVLCFYGLNLTDQFAKESVGFRCGVVTLGQLPLVFLLSGKNNIVGFFIGVSYERLNWLHRWTARCMLLTATIHMGYFFSGTRSSLETCCLYR